MAGLVGYASSSDGDEDEVMTTSPEKVCLTQRFGWVSDTDNIEHTCRASYRGEEDSGDRYVDSMKYRDPPNAL
jgi:hypothetical protein